MVRLFVDSAKLLTDLLRAFPNVLKMADLVSRYSSGMIGRAFAVPLVGIGDVLVARLRVLKVHNRLIRLDDAVRMFVRGPEEFLQEATLTDESGLVAIAIGRVARFLHRTFKNLKLLWVLQVKGEEEFVLAIIAAWKRRGFLYLWVLIIVAALLFVVILSTYVSVSMWSMVFVKGLEKEYLLPQDSKRTWATKGRVVRVNARRGPDEPSTVSA